MKRTLLVLLAVLFAFSAGAVTVPLQEGFENYPDGTPLNSLSNLGWGASSEAVAITTVTNVADAVRGVPVGAVV